MAEGGGVRLFVAVELPERIKDALGATITALRADTQGPFRWVAPSGIHLTLRFLGSVRAEQVDGLADAMTTAALTVEPFDLVLDGLGTFPPRRPPSVVWAGLGGDLAPLATLQSALEAGVVERGMAPETRAFHPHLTLARVRERIGREGVTSLVERLGATKGFDEPPFPVGELSLIRSELRPEGARYTRLAAAPLRRG
jgi:2'-5' RNA ligase